jgi:hypothetical protein
MNKKRDKTAKKLSSATGVFQRFNDALKLHPPMTLRDFKNVMNETDSERSLVPNLPTQPIVFFTTKNIMNKYSINMRAYLSV